MRTDQPLVPLLRYEGTGTGRGWAGLVDTLNTDSTKLKEVACLPADAAPNSGDFTPEGLTSRIKAYALDGIHTTVIGVLGKPTCHAWKRGRSTPGQQDPTSFFAAYSMQSALTVWLGICIGRYSSV